MSLERVLALAVLAGLCVCACGASAATSYYIRVRPAAASGLACKIALDLTHGDSLTQNRADILAFAHDGLADSAEVVGGPAYGDLINGTNPALSTSLETQFFENSLIVPFFSFGSVATFRLNLTEQAPRVGTFPDELAMYLLGRIGDVPYPTADGLGVDALFAIDITGQTGGELSVFSPMSFIPPDTLALEGNVIAVGERARRHATRLRALIPNPSIGGRVRFVCEIPSRGELAISVFDLAGRLIAKPFSGSRSAGTWTFEWDTRSLRGERVRPGVYIVQLQMAGESFVRRLVLAR